MGANPYRPEAGTTTHEVEAWQQPDATTSRGGGYLGAAKVRVGRICREFNFVLIWKK